MKVTNERALAAFSALGELEGIATLAALGSKADVSEAHVKRLIAAIEPLLHRGCEVSPMRQLRGKWHAEKMPRVNGKFAKRERAAAELPF